ncbi:C40 family peptidase [Pedobacter sp. JY14-1]|uniref:C40 family peptidase n=1 Tax=Pedobacter sp. JY14-1 TaxID=3034151 RepID=UPI0023E0D518|nr:C40 family peptidase [Pedobacter sp. JY14-1]
MEYMEQQYAICRVAVAPLRTEPSDKAEIGSQLLFGDHVEVMEKQERWWHLRSALDRYEGWSDPKQLAPLSSDQYAAAHRCKNLVPVAPLNVAKDNRGNCYYLSPGSSLPDYQDGRCLIGNEVFELDFKPKQVDSTALPSGERTEAIITDAQFFLNAPYLWGGRNLFGIDCSGLTQVVFKLNGISLNRDAWQQAEQGTVVDFLQEAQSGDLAFFDNAEGRIIHVGIMISNDKILHASGKVRQDYIDNQGIYNEELGRYTHKLRIIKRFT